MGRARAACDAMIPPAAAGAVIDDAIAAGVFPAATVEVGSSAAPLWTAAFQIDRAAPFDLASLTKVIATTTVVMELVRQGFLQLDERVSAFFSEWRGADRDTATVRDLLEHASGLPARMIDAPPAGRREFEHEICAMPLEYPPRTRSVYSDLGFILLGFLAADRGGAALDELFERVMVRLKTDPMYEISTSSAVTRHQPDRRGPPSGGPPDVLASARRSQSGRAHAAHGRRQPPRPGARRRCSRQLCCGAGRGRGARRPVRDGLGSWRVRARDSACLTRRYRRDAAVFSRTSRDVHGKNARPRQLARARLGYDASDFVMRHANVAAAFGHVGYTGTSLWIDPVRDRYFVLLTNRVFGAGTLDEMRTVRRAFHDALGDV